MALSSLHYQPPVRRSVRPLALDYALLDEAASLADEGKAAESVSRVYQHLFPSQPIADLAKVPFSFVQGSSRVTSRVDGDTLVITVRLARLPSGGSAVAALRYTLTHIAGTGQLYQPRLYGEELWLEFRERLSTLHPSKLLEVLRKMPLEADDRDDWLIAEFGAEPLDRVAIEPLTADELAAATRLWKAHWAELEELSRESQRKRSLFFLNEVTALALFRLRASLPLCGVLGTRLGNASDTFNDGDVEPLERETALTKFVKEMRAVTPEALAESLGHAEYALSPLTEGTPVMLTRQFGPGNYMEAVEGYRRAGKSLEAALALICSRHFLLARYAWPEEVEAALRAGLAATATMPFREAAAALVVDGQALVERYGGEEEEEEDEEGEDQEGGEDDGAEEETEGDES